MPTTITHGFVSDAASLGDYIDEIKATRQTEVSERRGTSGNFTKIANFNPTADFSWKGGGNPAISLGVGTATINGLTGGIKNIPKVDHTEKNNDFDDFEASGKHYPNAS